MRLLRKTVEFALSLWPIGKGKTESTSQDQSLEELEGLLKYHFRNRSLLEHSLTHKSRMGQEDRKGLLSNERLEFLGDSFLNALVTEHLYQLHPTHSEGQLSKMKSLIVSRKILGDIGASIELGKFLYLGTSERKTGGHKRKSIMSNAFEAVIGAIYLDGGLDACRRVLALLLFCRIDEFLSDENNINYKSRILEMAQRDGLGIPCYRVLSTTGPEHDKNFTVGIEIAGVHLGTGVGSNKKIAQQRAANEAIAHYDTNTLKAQEKGVTDDDELVPDGRARDDRRDGEGNCPEKDHPGSRRV